jgi:dTDP-4-dehydrorhamnose reductase
VAVVSEERPLILLLGAQGQLGRELAAALAGCGTVIACDRASVDITDAASVERTVRRSPPTFIVNAAAYTAVDRAEGERDAAFAVNATAPGLLAAAARRTGAVLIHYSTDYVFDGERTTPYGEDVVPHPLNVYGASKLAGEQAIADSGAVAMTLRTSWVYSRHGQNFLTTMQRLAAQRDELRVVDDQIGTPNWTRAIARATVALIERGPADLAKHAGVYHLSAAGAATWCDFARAILRDTRVRVVPIVTSEYPTPAARPRYGVLDSSKFARTFGFSLPEWTQSLRECLDSATEPSRAFRVN